MDTQGYSVSDINRHIREIFERHEELSKIPVVGEISNFKRYASGHCYFTLKDASSALRCVMFRGYADKMRFVPKNGQKVVAFGSISVYERDGAYQLQVMAMRSDGIGSLMQAYEALKEKLLQEGLFEQSRKKPLPLLPKTIGVVTSSSGAAVHDIITVSRRRNPGVRILLYPVKVQGEEAAGEIVKAIEFFNRTKLAELLIVGRGGGSIEDLWAFNEEPVVRAVAASDIPVISAVGHETDFTLCDFAADRRAATPSQAAEIAVIDVNAYKNGIASLIERGKNCLQNKISDQMQFRDSLHQEMVHTMSTILEQKKHQFVLLTAKLNALSPLAVMARGYTMTWKEDHTPVANVDQVAIGDTMTTVVTNGTIQSVVCDVQKKA
ncbi:MAG TPA: exodeoxyribonuclease VII large subunit [Dialister sp.]|nr:exodeoxyribonuclease VII large subunit [Dialister sp.]